MLLTSARGASGTYKTCYECLHLNRLLDGPASCSCLSLFFLTCQCYRETTKARRQGLRQSRGDVFQLDDGIDLDDWRKEGGCSQQRNAFLGEHNQCERLRRPHMNPIHTLLAYPPSEPPLPPLRQNLWKATTWARSKSNSLI